MTGALAPFSNLVFINCRWSHCQCKQTMLTLKTRFVNPFGAALYKHKIAVHKYCVVPLETPGFEIGVTQHYRFFIYSIIIFSHK